MPWSHTSPMDQKTQFIADDLRDRLSMPELCQRYGVSRKTGYQGVDRDLIHGPQGLEERSRRPSTSPRQPPDSVAAAILDARQRQPAWGAKKLVSLLSARHPRWPWPARSTVCDILSRHGLVPKRPKRRAIGHPDTPISHMGAPNEVWSADCTGQFTTGDGLYGYPLTVADGYSRFLLGCQALASTRVAEAKPVCTRLFKAFGLPTRLRTDHGVPLATNPLGRLSPRPAWWVRLGSFPECIEPGTPQQNGRHERMHQTLKAETTRPPARTRRAQQRTLDRFRVECNGQRPPEALNLQPRASRDEPLPRQMPNRWPPLAYPDRFEVHDVSANGASGGTINGSTFHTPALANTSALRTSTRASGMSTSDRSHAAGCSNDTCASKMPMVDSHDAGDCDPCLRTML
jgi:putative transposase